MTPRIVFMGTPDFAVASLDAIRTAGYDIAAVVTTPDRPAGRGQKVTASAVKTYAEAHHLPLMQPERLRDEHFIEALRQLHADIFVVVAFRMLPQCVWEMPPMGTFNLHASLLPRYRGAAPINRAIMNGEKETGVTTFLLNEHIDEGAILLQETTPISDNDNAETLHDRLAQMGRRIVVQTIDGLYHHRIVPQKQMVQTDIPVAPKIFKEDCRINWNQDGLTVRNFIRGLSPYPAAFTTIQNTSGDTLQLKIFDCQFVATTSPAPCRIETDGKKNMSIGVANGKINIISLQMSGKRRTDITDFLRGHNVNNWIIDN